MNSDLTPERLFKGQDIQPPGTPEPGPLIPVRVAMMVHKAAFDKARKDGLTVFESCNIADRAGMALGEVERQLQDIRREGINILP